MSTENPEVEKKAPKAKTGFNPSKKHAEVFGCPGTRYCQDGKYYDADGKLTKGPE